MNASSNLPVYAVSCPVVAVSEVRNEQVYPSNGVITESQRNYNTFNSSTDEHYHSENPSHCRRKAVSPSLSKSSTTINAICIHLVIISLLWSILFMTGVSTQGRYPFYSFLATNIFQDAKGGLPLVALALPILSAASITSFFYLPYAAAAMNRYHKPITSTPRVERTRAVSRTNVCSVIQQCFYKLFFPHGSGDADMDRIAVVFLVLPVTIHILSRICSLLSDEHFLSAQQRAKVIGNELGVVSTIAMSFWLIPVSRHQILLYVVAACHPNKVIRLHMWCGWIALLGISLHASCHIIRWKYLFQEDILPMFIPPVMCWKWNSITTPVCHDTETPCTCHDKFRNLMGLVAIIVLSVTTITSVPWFRRKFYALFYRTHISMALLFVVTTVLHWRKMILYLCPSLLVYAASTSTFVLQTLSSYRRGGVKLESFTIIPNSGNVTELCFKATQDTMAALNIGALSLYAKLCVPSFSYIWHPFSVVPSVERHPNNTVRILFRAKGKFTNHLRDALMHYNNSVCSECSHDIPLLLFDGFYGGEIDRVKQAVDHDRIVMVAGGIGITFFLSFLPNLLVALTSKQGDASFEILTKEVYLHWICREEGLVDYVLTRYLFPVIRSLHQQCSDAVKLKILIYCTSTDVKAAEGVHGGKITVGNNSMLGRTKSWNASGVGLDVTPAVMCPSWKTSRIQNIIPSLLCVTTYWGGLFVIWNQYIKYKTDDRIWVSLTGLFFLFGLSIYVSILALYVLQRSDKLAVCQDASTMVSDAESSTASQTNACTSHCPLGVRCQLLERAQIVHLSKDWSRPSMEDIILGGILGKVNSTGVFLCGPDSLVKDVRQYVSSLSYGCTRSARYSIYEESFCL